MTGFGMAIDDLNNTAWHRLRMLQYIGVTGEWLNFEF